MRKLLTAFLLITLVITGSIFAVDQNQIKQITRANNIPSFLGYVPDRLIVVFKENTPDIIFNKSTNDLALSGDASLDAIASKYAVSKFERQFKGSEKSSIPSKAALSQFYKVTLNTGELDDAVKAYEALPMVDHVEKIGIHAMYATPNDSYFSPYQWYHAQTNDDDIDSPEGWDIQTGSTSTIIALLDSGTRYYHPDLGGANASVTNPTASRGNMWINTTELNGSSGVDDDGNGYVDDWIGYDFISSTTSCWSGEDCNTKDNDPRDFNGHGTHTAGIMAMITNDGYGMAGVAGGWNNGSQAEYGNGCKVMPLRMGYSYNYLGQEYGVVLMDAAAEAFYYAADNGAKIASCSWGSSNSGGIGTAATYFLNNGGLIFVAAGNDGTQTADYLNGRGDCISVAATDENDAAASFTTYGTWVDISAPGNNIYATYHDHTDANTIYWASLSGTSMATPMTAATAAMIWAQNPTWTASQVRTQLYSSADNIDAELSSTYIGKMGAGRINLYNAVNTGTPAAPVANFSGTPTSGTEPLTVVFTDLSTGSITSWSWAFGDGGTSTTQNPSHQYTSAGTYNVTLTVTGPGGSDGETKNGYITVNACTPPTAGFVGSPTSGDYPLSVSFTNQSTGATSYSWNFGDGGTSTSTNPSHTYTSAGTFTVTLTATNSCGSDQMVRTNYITVTTPPCYAPVADFSGSPISGDYNLLVTFTDLSTNSPTSWSWTFGDGGTSTSQNPSHTYTSAGTYTVSLTATNSCGSDGETKAAYITVTEPPVSDWTVITYDDFESGMGNYTDGGTDMLRYTSGTYAHQGNAAADIQDNSGTASSFYHTLGCDVSGYIDLEVDFWFYAVSMETAEDFWLQYYNGSAWQTIATWAAGTNFTNGSFYHEVVAISSGSYNFPTNAQLRFLCDASGDADDIYIDEIEFRGSGTPAPPVADFSGTPTSGEYPLTVSFTDQSDGTVTSWSWAFGDGGTSTAQNPNHTYTAAGSYNVTLTVTGPGGSDGETKNGYITVTEPPVGSWITITYDDFESGMGSYTDGGGDMSRYISGTYAHQGSAAADIQDNSGVASSFYHTGSFNVSGYSELEVEFWFYAVSMDNTSEDFWVQYYDGSTWQTVATFARTTNFNNGVFYNEVVTIPSGSYNYPSNAKLRFLCDASDNNDDIYIDEIEFRGFNGTASAAKPADMIPDEYALHQNYPNPFNPATEIGFSLPKATHVSLIVYNLLGQTVETLIDEDLSAGPHSITFDASQYSSGVYFYRLQTNDFAETKKMILVK